jgi:hypothetical protein
MSFRLPAIDRPVTEILQQMTFLKTRVLLLHNCPNLSSQNRSGHRTGADAQNVRESNP